MSLLKEFKKFAIKGNAIDMAVGIVIGTAFGKIITSLVNDIIMPPIGKLIGSVDFTNLYISLGNTTYNTLAEAEKAGAPIINYGNFLQTTVDFLLVAFSIFIVIRGINALKRKNKEEAPQEPSEEILILRDIRDNLKKK